eukprot:3223458-Amphidinium_carterae.1
MHVHARRGLNGVSRYPGRRDGLSLSQTGQTTNEQRGHPCLSTSNTYVTYSKSFVSASFLTTPPKAALSTHCTLAGLVRSLEGLSIKALSACNQPQCNQPPPHPETQSFNNCPRCAAGAK